MASAGAQVHALLLRQGVMQGLVQLLSQQHLRALATWPTASGGGSSGVEALLLAVTTLIHTPFEHAETSPGALQQLHQVQP